MNTKLAITILVGLFSHNVAYAKVYKFIPCVSEKRQSTINSVRELLNEPVSEGEADHVGYFELKKQGQVVGYFPFYIDKNKTRIGSAYLCTEYWGNYFYVDGKAEDIKEWMPKNGKTVVIKDLFNDEAVSNLKVTKINDTEVSIDFFVRDLANGSDVIKDTVTLFLVPKYEQP